MANAVAGAAALSRTAALAWKGRDSDQEKRSVRGGIAGRKDYARDKLTNGSKTLPDTDGRLRIARRFRDIAAAILVDQGSKFGGYDTSMRWVSGPDDDSGATWKRARLQAFINSGGRVRL